MVDQNVSSSKTKKEKPERRLPEVDAYVDHFLSTMCESSRRQILELLAEPNRDEQDFTLERRSTDIARELGLSPSTTSEHLKQLTDSGLLTYRRDGNTVYYRIRNYLLIKAFNDLVVALHKEHASSSLDLSMSTEESDS